MKINETKLNELIKKLNLQGYALICLSTLMSKLENEHETSNETNYEITKIISKELVESVLSDLSINFLLNNNYIIKTIDYFEFTEKSQNLFETILQVDIKL